MKRYCILFFGFCFGFTTLPAQQIDLISIEELEARINRPTDSLVIINFWSTYCIPCIKELPYFETIQEYYAESPLVVLLVSVDYPGHLSIRVAPFIADNKIKSRVVLLNEKDPNKWIKRINSNWQGSIPATFIIYPPTGYQEFFEKEMELDELINIVESTIQRP